MLLPDHNLHRSWRNGRCNRSSTRRGSVNVMSAAKASPSLVREDCDRPNPTIPFGMLGSACLVGDLEAVSFVILDHPLI